MSDESLPPVRHLEDVVRDDAEAAVSVTGGRAGIDPVVYGVRQTLEALQLAEQARQEDQADGMFVGSKGTLFPADAPLRDLHGVMPADGSAPQARVYFVNGIWTDVDHEVATMQGLATTLHVEVVGIHNGTAPLALGDLLESAGNKLDIDTKAVDTLTRILKESVYENEPINVFAHSQGALCLSEAVHHAKVELAQDPDLDHDFVLDRLTDVHAQTFGGAAVTYEEGPQYVHHINEDDIVPTAFGYGHPLFSGLIDIRDALNHLTGARVDSFTSTEGDLSERHGMTLYEQHATREAIQDENVRLEVHAEVLDHADSHVGGSPPPLEGGLPGETWSSDADGFMEGDQEDADDDGTGPDEADE